MEKLVKPIGKDRDFLYLKSRHTLQTLLDRKKRIENIDKLEYYKEDRKRLKW